MKRLLLAFVTLAVAAAFTAPAFTDLVGEGTTSREELRTKVLNNMPLG